MLRHTEAHRAHRVTNSAAGGAPTSTAMHVVARSCMTTSTSGRPMLPAATVRQPGGAQHRLEHQRGRRLAVGAGDARATAAAVGLAAAARRARPRPTPGCPRRAAADDGAVGRQPGEVTTSRSTPLGQRVGLAEPRTHRRAEHVEDLGPLALAARRRRVDDGDPRTRAAAGRRRRRTRRRRSRRRHRGRTTASSRSARSRVVDADVRVTDDPLGVEQCQARADDRALR